MMRLLIMFSSAMAGLAVVMPLAAQMPLIRFIPVFYLVAFIPVTLIGGSMFLLGKRFEAMAPVTIALLMILIGVWWSRLEDIPRAFLLFIVFFVTASFAAVLQTEADWMLAARTFVLFTTISAGLIMWLSLSQGASRVGTVLDQNGLRAIEPNQVGTQTAFAILVGLTVLSLADAGGVSKLWNLAIYISVPFLVITLVLTQSRGAAISFVGALVVMFLMGRARKRVELVLFAFLLLAISPFVWYSLSDSLFARFSGAQVGTYGGRTEIWRAAADLMLSNAGIFTFGAGSGSAGSALGERSPYLADVLHMAFYSGYEGGVPRINTHSSFVEWWLSFGLLGLAVGLCVIGLLIGRSLMVDRTRMLASGTAFLVFFLLTSVSLVAYRLLGISVACGGVTLGYLYYQRRQLHTSAHEWQGAKRQRKHLTQSPGVIAPNVLTCASVAVRYEQRQKKQRHV